MLTLHLKLFDITVAVECSSKQICDILAVGFSAFFFVESGAPKLRYMISGDSDNGFVIVREGVKPFNAENTYQLLYYFEKDLTIELEHLRKDLFFVHGAAIVLDGKAILISAPSGSGKSTITWALLHHGFDYLSDELAPIELDSLNIEPFPHALNQKNHPPEPYPLPAQTYQTDCTLHVPIEALPCHVVHTPTPLAAMFYVKYNRDASAPSVTPLSVSEGCMNLFANGLNQLQHENKGLSTATNIAQRVPSFSVETADLEQSARMLQQFVSAL